MRRDATTRPDTAHVELYLSGDFGSPMEVLADESLTREQKREILATWLAEVRRQGGDEDRLGLARDLERALGDL